MARVLIGVTGGISAYKTVELARLAIKAGHSVRVLATPSAQHFVGRVTFEGITGAPVLISEFELDPMRGAFPSEPLPEHIPIGHLELAERADVYLIAPASANTVAKLAGGFADSALTTTFLACTAPRLLAPAMNDRMFENAATQRNLETLRNRGVTVIEPGTGQLASKGEYGVGRLPEPPQLLAALEAALEETVTSSSPLPSGSWAGRRVLITAGGTREALDPVRFLGNRSSGRMGYALAEAALARGAEVCLVSANVSLTSPAGARLITVESTAEMSAACQAEFGHSDLLVMAAAPADFRPAAPTAHKLNRDGDGLKLELEPTEDILAGLSSVSTPAQILVGFAAEVGPDVRERARRKLERKGVDMIVLNDVGDASIGFDSNQNAVTLITAEGHTEVPLGPKREIADAILDRVEKLS